MVTFHSSLNNRWDRPEEMVLKDDTILHLRGKVISELVGVIVCYFSQFIEGSPSEM